MADDGDDIADLEQHCVELANLAINFDKNSDNSIEAKHAARFYYQECVAVALKLLDLGYNGLLLKDLSKKAEHYLARAETLEKQIERTNQDTLRLEQSDLVKRKSDEGGMSDLKLAEFLLHEAMDADEAGKSDIALEQYTEAVEVCLRAKKSNNMKDSIKQQLTFLAEQALSRAEELKKPAQVRSRTQSNSEPQPEDIAEPPQCGSTDITTTQKATPAVSPSHVTTVINQFTKLKIIGPSSYSKSELEVLKRTSNINGREYVPFLSWDLKEKFAYTLSFNDPHGKLVLAPKQTARLKDWARIEDLASDPQVFADINDIDCFKIKQTLVSDCSFITALTVSALYEKRFKKRLISTIIYPQNRQGHPVYNPCGKYMVKLHINGIYRKVIIDDLFPVDHYNSLLCSHSVNKKEFWVSILEKAYMKVMGGFDFPGSNSNIDLHALTGWIPERISTRDKGFDADKTFATLMERHRKGDVLITCATGELSDEICERSGLVSTHAYAVLDLRQVEGHKLLLLKNPWSHVRWKGNYSERDHKNWTPSLKAALNYDPQNAKSFDDGVFYIDLKSLLKFYEAIYLNWRTSLFSYTYCTHDTWSAGAGPAKDLYYIGSNPQYRLSTGPEGAPVWVLLTRHITDKDDFAENREYIALIVYESGDKIFMPFSPAPMIDGARINSPHYLCKIPATPGQAKNYTLVISQYEKSNTIYYSLRAYSTHSFSLTKLVDNLTFTEKITDEWNQRTAGGCANHRDTYNLNPVYQIEVTGPKDSQNCIQIDLKAPKEYSIGFDIKTVNIRDPSSPNAFDRKSSGSYRSGYTMLLIQSIPAGQYHLIPSTFYPGQVGPFFLTVRASCSIRLNRIK